MIMNPQVATGDWKKLKSAFTERFSGPYTLVKEVGPNRWLIKEWAEEGLRHPIVNASKFKPVFEPPSDFGKQPFQPISTKLIPSVRLENDDTSPPAPLIRLPLAPPPVQPALGALPFRAPAPETEKRPVRLAAQLQFPRVSSIKIIKNIEQAGEVDANQAGNTGFDRTSFSVDVTVQTNAVNSVVYDSALLIKNSHQFHKAFMKILGSDTAVALISDARKTARQYN